ncbi:hypothetical protein [Bradyrhizobium cenepequi]
MPTSSTKRKAGRPKSTHCKRGHERVSDEKACIACRRLRERWKYQADDAFRGRKVSYQRQWRKDFFAAHGFWASALDERRTP